MSLSDIKSLISFFSVIVSLIELISAINVSIFSKITSIFNSSFDSSFFTSYNCPDELNDFSVVLSESVYSKFFISNNFLFSWFTVLLNDSFVSFELLFLSFWFSLISSLIICKIFLIVLPMQNCTGSISIKVWPNFWTKRIRAVGLFLYLFFIVWSFNKS